MEIQTTLDLSDHHGFVLGELDVTLVLEVDYDTQWFALDYVKIKAHKPGLVTEYAVISCNCRDLDDLHRTIWVCANRLVGTESFEREHMQEVWDEWHADRGARRADELWDMRA